MDSPSDVVAAWRACTANIAKTSHVAPSVWKASLEVLVSARMGRALMIWTVRSFEERMKKLSSKLCAIGETPYEEDNAKGMISSVHAEFREMRIQLEDLDNQIRFEHSTMIRRFVLKSRAILESGVSSSFPNAVYLLLRGESSVKDSGSQEHLAYLKNRANETNFLCTQLADLGFSMAVDDAISWVVFETIDELVSERTEGQLNAKALPTLRAYVDNFVVPWISKVLPSPFSSSSLYVQPGEAVDMDIDTEDVRERYLRQWKKRLSFHLHMSVGRIRINQLLRLIDQFPQSLPAVEDLKDCILSTDLKAFVTIALKEQFTQKMLNAGTVTSDILKQYVNMIRALRFLDPSDVILESVSDPVHEYLRRRPDTVRCIVSDMTGDGELYQELERGRSRRKLEGDGNAQTDQVEHISPTSWDQDQDDLLSVDGDLDANLRFDVEAYNNWEPEPIDAPSRNGQWRSGGDAITTLVAIYGSSEQIVNEYKGLLADKLSTHLEVDIEREARVLTLLTERFGREAMHDCDIMVKDFVDSVRIEEKMTSDVRRKLKSFETTVISKEFWPKLIDEPKFNAMPELQQQMAVFEHSYKKLKTPRTLNWQQSLGAVALKLEFDDGRKVNVTVSPAQATILFLFGQKRRQSLKEIQSKLGTSDENFVRRKVQGLANQGFLRAIDGTNAVYETVEHGADADVAAGTTDDDAGDGGGADGGDGGADDAEMAVYEKFVMTMLQHRKQLPLEQIHTMLQRFIQTPKFDKTQAQLATFLARLVTDGKVERSAGMYRVKGKPKS